MSPGLAAQTRVLLMRPKRGEIWRAWRYLPTKQADEERNVAGRILLRGSSIVANEVSSGLQLAHKPGAEFVRPGERRAEASSHHRIAGSMGATLPVVFPRYCDKNCSTSFSHNSTPSAEKILCPGGVSRAGRRGVKGS